MVCSNCKQYLEKTNPTPLEDVLDQVHIATCEPDLKKHKMRKHTGARWGVIAKIIKFTAENIEPEPVHMEYEPEPELLKCEPDLLKYEPEPVHAKYKPDPVHVKCEPEPESDDCEDDSIKEEVLEEDPLAGY